MSFKRAKVVMLPTNQKAKMSDLTMFGNKLVVASSVLHLAQVSQNLYFLSDDEIQVGDWVIMLDSFGNVFSNPQQYTNPNTQHLNKGLRKIIATTDESLTKIVEILDVNGYGKAELPLPQPSEAFIQKYVEAYNSGKPIKEVEIEYENLWVGYEPDYFEINGEVIDGMKKVYSIFLKVNQNDNTITIKKTKDSWSREEIISDIESAIVQGLDLGQYRDKWIE